MRIILHIWCLTGGLLMTTSFLFAQQSIEQVRLLPEGSIVTTTGIVTSGPELGLIRYMQDNKAGIALYSSSISELIPGDSIVVSGVLTNYNGQLQISPVHSHQILSSGHSLPVPVTIDLSLEDPGKYESMRAFLPCIGISSCETKFDPQWFIIFDQSGYSARLSLPENHILNGQPIPEEAMSFDGIWTVRDGSFTLIGGDYSIIPFDDPPVCQLIDKGIIRFDNFSPVTLEWRVIGANDFIFYYGEDSFDHTDYAPGHDEQLLYFFDSLAYGRIYKGRIRFIQWGDTAFSLPVYFSPQKSTEPGIEVLFNNSVSTSYSDGSSPYAVGSSVIEADLIDRIESVSSTLDVAMYNTTHKSIIEAINMAAARGVDVRYIADDETSNTALHSNLSFPVLFRNGDGIMHNKFMIGDAEITDSAWVWTGSTNFSFNQLQSDPNHAIVIRDQAMAQNYLREFEEMWGNPDNNVDGKHGISKSDNTAHTFKMGETIIESYFSPSDETNCHIIEAIRSADHHIEIGLLLLTKEDLVDELIYLHQEGVDVRVIVDDHIASSLALSRLAFVGIKTGIHNLSTVFHHKYAIVDEGYPDSDPLVITGSHNWTFSADNINDENTLIVHSQSVANIFRQEFEARWMEFTPSATVVPFIEEISIQPNPAVNYVIVKNPRQQNCIITLLNVNGMIISNHNLQADDELQLPLDNFPNGIYLIHWKWLDDIAISRFTIQQ